MSVVEQQPTTTATPTLPNPADSTVGEEAPIVPGPVPMTTTTTVPVPIQLPPSFPPLAVHARSPVLEPAFQDAKAFIKSVSSAAAAGSGSTGSLYDHLTQVLIRVLQQRPSNATDIIEQISADVKRLTVAPAGSTAIPRTTVPGENARLQETIKLLDRAAGASNDMTQLSDAVADGSGTGDLPDIVALSHLFEAAGVSLGVEETILLAMAVKQLAVSKQLKSARFFGKIHGALHGDYFIVESELHDGDEQPPVTDSAAVTATDGDEVKVSGNNGDKSVAPVPVPAPPATPVPNVAAEASAVGVNKYVYWVTSRIGAEWTRLPDAQPKFIQQARSIRKCMTGSLDAKISSYPPFDGTEADYLRAQIARISAATVISPVGYYHVDEPDEDAEPEQHADTPDASAVVLNEDFEWPGQDNLLQAENWVHHIAYLLPQGRTTWVHPYARPARDGGDDGDAAGDDENDEGDDEVPVIEGAPHVDPEQGPGVLLPIADDSALDGGDVPAWTIRLATALASRSRHSPVMLRSNRWPGAVTVGYDQKFANIYVGWGLKEQQQDDAAGFLPQPLPRFQQEYQHGEEQQQQLVEQRDPTLEEETAFAESVRQAEAAAAQANAKEESVFGDEDGADKTADDDADEDA